MVIRTAKQWKVRPSELLEIADPYEAYCLDTACNYIAEQLQRKRLPKFPEPGAKGQGRTTNAEIIAEMQKANKRTGGGR